jgi:FkbM family methyltransferase
VRDLKLQNFPNLQVKTRMPNNIRPGRARITPSDAGAWIDWPAVKHEGSGALVRRLRSGAAAKVEIQMRPAKKTLLAVATLHQPLKAPPEQTWNVTSGEKQVVMHYSRRLPLYLLLEIPVQQDKNFPLVLFFEPRPSSNKGERLDLLELTILPLNGRFSPWWTSPWRGLRYLLTRQRARWSPSDFPYSHFDGVGYLLEHRTARLAVLTRKYRSAYSYYHFKGRTLGHSPPLALDRDPLPGTPFNLAEHYSRELERAIKDITEHQPLKEEVFALELQLRLASAELEQFSPLNFTDPSSTPNANNTDRGLDAFIIDIFPFFYGKKITYVDVGAYRGAVFRKLARSGIAISEAHLYEPNAANLPLIRRKTKDLKSRVLINGIAIGSTRGEGRIISKGSMSRVLTATTADVKGQSTVEIDTLDNQKVAFTDGRIHLLKIDVEGSEIAVLDGARSLLEQHMVDVIYVEAGFGSGNSQQTYFQKILAALEAHRYRLFKVYEQRNEWMDDAPLLRRADLVFMSESFASRHPQSLVKELMALKSAQATPPEQKLQ